MTVQTLPALWQRVHGAASPPISVESAGSSVVEVAAQLTTESTAAAGVPAPGSPAPATLSSPTEVPLRSKLLQVMSAQVAHALDRLEGPDGEKVPAQQRQTLVRLLVAAQLDLLDPSLSFESRDQINNVLIKTHAMMTDPSELVCKGAD